MPIGEAIAAGKALVEVSKLVTNLINSPDTDPQHVRNRLQEMLIHLVNAQTALSEAQQEIMDLRTKLAAGEVEAALEADVEFEQDGNFWVRKSEREKALVPYCPACWGKDKKLVAMAPYKHPGVFRCPLHEKTAYTTKVYEEWRRNQPAQRVVQSDWLRPRDW
jgi:hypothetical protein